MDRIVVLEKKIARLKKSQKEAEDLLEMKSREIFAINEHLEEEVKTRTQEFETARDEAIKANRAKSQFLANMSHEIRTPLNGMLGFVGLLLKSEMNDSQIRQLKVVHESGHFLLGIINDILEFSKIEAGKLEVEHKEVHLQNVIESIADIVANQIYDKGLECPVYIDETLPEQLMTDEAKIRQTLINLVGNAIKFTPTGEVGIRVQNEGLDDLNRVRVRFEIRDTGIGIPKDKLGKIFVPFEQADVSDTRKYGGTGLGLSISRQFVEAMDGEMAVTSIESEGSCFSFTIPMESAAKVEKLSGNTTEKNNVGLFLTNTTVRNNLNERLTSWGSYPQTVDQIEKISFSQSPGSKNILIADGKKISDSQDILTLLDKGELDRVLLLVNSADVPEAVKAYSDERVYILPKPIKRSDLFQGLFGSRSNVEKEESNAFDGSATKSAEDIGILLVEDNLINQQVALAMLGAHGFTADIANNGQEAVDMFSQKSYDIILMDCQMPVMDGFDATKKIRETDSNIPIIAMTANAFRKTKEDCFEAGMSEFVTKPVSDDHLSEIIHKYTRLKAS